MSKVKASVDFDQISQKIMMGTDCDFPPSRLWFQPVWEYQTHSYFEPIFRKHRLLFVTPSNEVHV